MRFDHDEKKPIQPIYFFEKFCSCSTRVYTSKHGNLLVAVLLAVLLADCATRALRLCAGGLERRALAAQLLHHRCKRLRVGAVLHRRKARPPRQCKSCSVSSSGDSSRRIAQHDAIAQMRARWCGAIVVRGSQRTSQRPMMIDTVSRSSPVFRILAISYATEYRYTVTSRINAVA